ncbi:mitochondrial import inner membrane translocase subunit tim-13 [Magnaporthiopsis poae ATCC 64411]|uniref:Mitochondrial import inner membrane translocase subunit n=1 Tax=Magnaporthiopsis poae (strain ATCC 64411 / 73-15) TaxID=644358 RepID=A0A0C4E642_MAGP6|nr:mitochondrial import inner membrane translocase subunit tim-13 [Magnaporthiopsis poae ATCC 64411]
MWFSGSKPTPPPTETPLSEFSDMPPAASTAASAADSDGIKKAFMRQVQLESQSANARTLMEKINSNCFEKCVPAPGGSMSAGQSACVTQCMEKYMTAWNLVHSSYVRRLQQEAANGGIP